MQLRCSALHMLVIWLSLLTGALAPMVLDCGALQAQEGDVPSTAMDREQRPGMDRFDLRAAEEPGQTEKLSLVRKTFERQRWDEGVQQLQRLLNEEQDSLYFGEDQVWRPVSEVAIDLIRKAPSEARQAYDTRFGAVATRELAQARKSRDLIGLVQIARRYLLTPAGQQASREVIDAAIDHGNRDSLAKLVGDLILIDSPQLQDAQWRSQIAGVLRASGHTSLAKTLSDSAPPSTEPTGHEGWWMSEPLSPTAVPMTSWLTLSGSPTGQGMALVEESTLLPRWRQTLATSPRTRKLLQNIEHEFEDQGLMGFSVLATIGSEEYVVTRTLSNLTAVNARTGQVLWTTHEWGLAPHESDAESQEPVPSFDLITENDAEGSLHYHARKRLTTSGSLGSLSANSRSVFSLARFDSEESELESIVQPGFEETEEPIAYLYARDLRTGRTVWRAGGPISEEPPGLPAAGVTFFGPPTPDGDELLGVGERDGDILLFCLEAETGIVRWEQLLAAAGRRLTEDLVRRSWTAPVAVRGSLVICPTTTGWVTAVDRVTRRIVWSQRIIERASSSSPPSELDLSFEAPNRDVGQEERWPPLQPILLSDRVIVAPMELPDETGATLARLLCYDLLTGQKLWEIPKDQAIGVIGATDEFVYLFDQRTVQAYRCDTGVQAWKCSHIEAAIAGRPVLTSDGIVVPTRNSSMVLVDPAKGKVLNRLQISTGDKPHSQLLRLISTDHISEMKFGNLISLGGRLISVSPFEMIAFEWTSEEAQSQSNAKTNPTAAIHWAKLLALRGQISEAIQTLRDASRLDGTSGQISAQIQQSLALLLLLQAEGELQAAPPDLQWREWLKEASTAVTSPADREAILRLEIQLSLHSGDWEQAWTGIQEAIRRPLQNRVEIGQRVVHAEVWLADQIRTLAQIPERTRSDAMRESLRQFFSALWKESETKPGEQQRLLRLFAETAFVDQFELDSLATSQSPARLSRLLALTHSRTQATAQQATIQLIELLATPDWVGEARRRLADLPDAANWPKNLSRTRADLEQLLDRVTDLHRQPPPNWLGAKIEMFRKTDSAPGPDMEASLRWIGPPCEALENYRYSFDQVRQLVTIERQAGSHFGEIPLNSGSEISDFPLSPVLYASDFHVYVNHSGNLHAYSIPNNQLLWKRRIQRTNEYPQNDQQMALLSPSAFQENRRGFEYRRMTASVEVANDRQIVVRSRRGIEVLCALTGELLWELSDCPSETVRCDEERLYRFTGHKVIAYSIRSGRPLEVSGLSEFSNVLFPLDASGITTLSEKPDDSQMWHFEGYQFRGETIPGRAESDRDRWDEGDQLALQSVWKLPVHTHSLLGNGPPGQGVLLDHTSELNLIHWSTGRVQSCGKAENLSVLASDTDANVLQVNSAWDRFRIYLMTDSAKKEHSINCPSVPVHGHVLAFSRERSEWEWTYPFEGHLLTSAFLHNPLLPLIQLEDSEVAGNSYQKLHLAILDKQTGKAVHELRTKSYGTGVADCRYSPTMQSWKLFLQGESIQITKQTGASP